MSDADVWAVWSVKDSTGRTVAGKGPKTFQLKDWVCEPFEEPSKGPAGPIAARPATQGPSAGQSAGTAAPGKPAVAPTGGPARPAVTAPTSGPSAVSLSAGPSAVSLSAGPSALTAGPSGPAGPNPTGPPPATAAPATAAPATAEPVLTPSPGNVPGDQPASVPSYAPVFETEDSTASFPEAAVQDSTPSYQPTTAPTPSNDYSYAPESSAAPTMYPQTIDGGTITLGTGRDFRVQQNDYINWGLMTQQGVRTVQTGAPPAQVPLSFSPQLPPFPAAQLPPVPPVSPPLPEDTAVSYADTEYAPNATDVSGSYEDDLTAWQDPLLGTLAPDDADYVSAAYDEGDVTAWQDPLLGTLAPVETDSKGMIWMFYAACWVLIVVFWLYYWLKKKR